MLDKKEKNMAASRILFAGEQVTSISFEIKGFDHFGVTAFKEDSHALLAALSKAGHRVDWLRTCDVPAKFPETAAELKKYQAVVLSDVGSNSLLFHPEMLSKSIRHPNRMTLLRQYVAGGGGLAMVGGWMSFAGIDGRARYHDTAVEEALPVTSLCYDDRQERPEGLVPKVLGDHPILARVPRNWPYFLGYNKVTAKAGAQTLLRIGPDPLLTVWEYGRGRSAAFMSDCAPHWGPEAFLKWRGYGLFWDNLMRWLTKRLA